MVIVGTGETSELTARALSDSGVPHRVRGQPAPGPRAQPGPALSDGESVSFDELPAALERADIVVTATASPHLLLEARELGEVMAGRPERPMLMIDLAVPRDIDAACGGDRRRLAL